MLDGRAWNDVLTTVSGFNEISGVNLALRDYPNIKDLRDFNILKVGEIYIPHGENNITYKNVEEEHYTSGYFILSDGDNVQIRVCDGMFIPIFTSFSDEFTLLGIRVHLVEGLIEFNIDTCSPFGVGSGYYQKKMQPLLSDWEDQIPPKKYQELKEIFSKRFEKGYTKHYPLLANDKTS